MRQKIILFWLLFIPAVLIHAKTAPAYNDYRIIRITQGKTDSTGAPGLYIFHKDRENNYFTASEHKNILGWHVNAGDILLLTNPAVKVTLFDGKTTINVQMNGPQIVLWTSPVQGTHFFYERNSFFDEYGYKKNALLEEQPALFKGKSLLQSEAALTQSVRDLNDKRRLTKSELQLVLQYSILLKDSGAIELARATLESFLPRAKQSQDKQTAGSFYSYLGDIYFLAGHINRAKVLYKQMIDIRFALYQDVPYETAYAVDLIIGYLKLGTSYNSTGDKKNALIFYKKSLNIHKKISLLSSDEKLQELLEFTYFKMGDALLYLEYSSIRERNENLNQALGYYREAASAARDRYNKNPGAHKLRQLLYGYNKIYNFYYETGNAQAEAFLKRQIQLVELYQQDNKGENFYIESALIGYYRKLVEYYMKSLVPGILEQNEFAELQKTLKEAHKQLLYELYLFDNELLQYKLAPRISEEKLVLLEAVFSESGLISEKKLLPALQTGLTLLDRIAKKYPSNIEVLEMENFLRGEYAKIIDKEEDLITVYSKNLEVQKSLFNLFPENLTKYNQLMATFSGLKTLLEKKNDYTKILSLLEDQNSYQSRGLSLFPADTGVRESYVENTAGIVRLYLLIGNTRRALDRSLALYRYTKEAAGGKGKTIQDIRNFTIAANLAGDVYSHKGSHESAVDYYKEALDFREKHYNKEKDPFAIKDLAASYSKMADVYVQQDELDKALELYKKALALLETGSSSSTSSTRKKTAAQSKTEKKRFITLKNRKNTKEPDNKQPAQDSGEKAGTNQRAADYQMQLEIIYSKIGTLYFKQNNMNQAYSSFEKSLAIIKSLLDKQKDNSTLLEAQVILLSKLANIDIMQKKWDPALTKLTQAADTISALHKTREGNTALQLEKAIVFVQLGDVYFTGKNNLDQAGKEYIQALPLLSGLFDLDRNNPDRAYDLSALYYKLGNLARHRGRSGEAVQYFSAYQEIESRICRLPGIKGSRIFDLSLVYNYLGDISYNTRNYRGAVKEYEKSVQWREKLYRESPDNKGYLEALTVTYSKIGTAYYLLKQYKSALLYYKKDADLSKEHFEKNKNPQTALLAANALYNLGVVTQKTAGLAAGSSIINEAKEILLAHKSNSPEYVDLLNKMK